MVSLGSSLKGGNRKIWRDVERKVAESDPDYFFGFNMEPLVRNVEKEFFVLAIDGDYVGRGISALDKNWMGRTVGFIDDFMICEAYRKDADLLIDRCLSSLKVKGALEVMVRGGLFPAIETKGYEDAPPFGCPHNPPWYADLFERNGFSPTRRFVNYRIEIPKILLDGKVGKDLTDEEGREIRELKRRKREELKKYIEIMSEASFARFFGWDTAGIEMGKRPSRTRLLLNGLLTHIVRYKTFCTFENGKMIGCTTIHPDYNAILKNLTAGKRGVKTGIKLLGFPFALRKAERYVFGGTAQIKEARGKGYGEAKMVWGVYNIIPLLGNVKEFDTGPIVAENLPPIKMVKALVGEEGVKQMDYMMMSYEVKA